MSDAGLDAVDQAILYHLQQNSRKSITDIADAVDVSDNTIRNRIHDMEDKGVIQGYDVDVDYDTAGVQHYYLFVCSVRVSKREELANEVRKLPGVVEVITLMTGTHNVYIIASSHDKDGITDLASDVDELGVSIEQEHLIRDHVKQAYSGFRPPDYMSRD